MVNKFIKKGKDFLISPQNSIISAATVVMMMVLASRALGLVRQRILANYFNPDDLSLFFAAFRLPDAIFQVLVFGTFSSAFIPVFTKTLRDGEAKAWLLAGKVVSIGLAIFFFAVAIIGFGAVRIYAVIAPGYGATGTAEIAFLARILFAAQGFF